MMEQDDMKAGLLEELIQKLMEMKEGGGHDSPKPDASVAMLDIKKDPDQDGDDDSSELSGKDPMKPDLSAALAGKGDDADCGPDEASMKKPLGPSDFAMMARKHKLGM